LQPCDRFPSHDEHSSILHDRDGANVIRRQTLYRAIELADELKVSASRKSRRFLRAHNFEWHRDGNDEDCSEQTTTRKIHNASFKLSTPEIHRRENPSEENRGQACIHRMLLGDGPQMTQIFADTKTRT
jgi:hypothetical protein